MHQDQAQTQPMDPQDMFAAHALQKVHALRAMARSKYGEANLLNDAAMALEMTLIGTNPDAKQKPKASPDNAGSGAQSPVRGEGGYTAKSR